MLVFIYVIYSYIFQDQKFEKRLENKKSKFFFLINNLIMMNF